MMLPIRIETIQRMSTRRQNRFSCKKKAAENVEVPSNRNREPSSYASHHDLSLRPTGRDPRPRIDYRKLNAKDNRELSFIPLPNMMHIEWKPVADVFKYITLTLT
ncbi:hypothetical protein TNCV_3023131 [Trichonephila clavipes]|uniref:Uncharacterized protein n=1 Tax=Trichonephila clavipes TaxID=2585209 RepID=A0A8X6RUL2_TRICX|nr:hypothetical protein TNCV_3023131 [Trichonephila clavipes]